MFTSRASQRSQKRPSGRFAKIAATLSVGALALVGCSSDSGGGGGDGDSYSIGINQFVQHPALDAATEGFKQAFTDAGVDVEFTERNANGEQSTALTIAQQFATDNLDLVLSVATPAAQATAQNIQDTPVLFTAVTDPVAAELVDSMESPGGNITGTSDAAPVGKQLDMLKELVPDAGKVGIVYSSGEVNSQVQVDEVKEEAKSRDLEIVTQTVTNVTEIPQAVEAIGDVDAFYVPTDNMLVSGIASLVQAAEASETPVIGAESGTVEGGAAAALGIDYTELGRQTGEMALRILRDGDKPGDMAVEKSDKVTYFVNEEAGRRQGVTFPQNILDEAETL